ncbi:MAG: molybdopterin-dependent oxidoreductase [Gemmatimonadetes bacterium]|nr:molybdopterin-dependent oxidoreductase [Gemmatimonadota bacterium]
MGTEFNRDTYMSYGTRLRMLAASMVVSLAVTAAPVAAQQGAPSIAVSGAVPKPLTLTATDLAAMPRASVTTTNNGIATKYEGVWLAEVLRKAGLPIGNGLRGGSLSMYVLAAASDGYQVLFSLGELDPEITDGQYLVADAADGKPLFGEMGAFRLVVPGDKRGARSIRMLASVTVVQTKR